jgi:predicted Zn-dependent protease
MFRLLVVLVAAMTFGGCAGVGSESFLISDEDEIALGAEYHAQLLQEMPPYAGDPAVQQWVRAIGNKLAKVSDRPDLAFTFTVVQSDEINAFAVPGGYIYVTTGLLEMAETGAEVATVLAHEIGHVAARHGVQAMENYMLAQGIYELLGGDELAALVAGAVQIGTGLTFDQDQEREADRLGVAYAVDGGFNPWGMVDFFSALKGLEGSGSGDGGILQDLGELFSTHPPTDERISNVKSQIQKLGVARDEASLLWDFAAGLAAIQEILDLLGVG